MSDTKRGSKAYGVFLILLITGITSVVHVSGVFTLESFLEHKDFLREQVSAYPCWSAIAFGMVYVFITGLSIPGAAVLSLSAGALFGFLSGLILCSFASTGGACLAFLTARYLFRDAVYARYPDLSGQVNRQVELHGGWYLISLRLVPFMPFFVVNIVMGLTSMRLSVFYVLSQLGMLPGAMVYVNAGTQLSTMKSLSDVYSPAVLGSLLLLALLPLTMRFFLGKLGVKKEREIR